jgi:hypothetical protein
MCCRICFFLEPPSGLHVSTLSPVPFLCPGVLPFTGGDALIYNHAISSEGGLDCVRPLMGVCPQFDVLWQQLSGREHLILYGQVKGLSFDQVGAGSVMCCVPSILAIA